MANKKIEIKASQFAAGLFSFELVSYRPVELVTLGHLLNKMDVKQNLFTTFPASRHTPGEPVGKNLI